MSSAYTFTCNLLVEPPKVDRFYMDMRVYTVMPAPLASSEKREKSDLVWRGIYLAYRENPAENEA